MGVAASASTHPGGALAARALSDPPLVCRRSWTFVERGRALGTPPE